MSKKAKLSLRQVVGCYNVFEKNIRDLERDIKTLRGNGDNWENNIANDGRESVQALYQILLARRTKMNLLLDSTYIDIEEGMF